MGAVLLAILSEQKICKTVHCVAFGPAPCFSDEMCKEKLAITSFVAENDLVPHASVFSLRVLEYRLA